MIKTTWTTLFSAAIALGLAFAAPASAQDLSDAPAALRTITVGGVGEVAVVPDMARIEVGVATNATTANDALKANNDRMARLVAVLDTVGVGARDRQTSNLQIAPDYEYEGPNNRQILRGYIARNTLSLRIRDLDSMGDVLDALVEAGANQLNGISFDVAEKAALLDEARRAAVADARSKAETLAQSAGVSLGAVHSVVEPSAINGPRPMMRSNMISDAESVPIEAGEQMLQIRVTVVWTIAP